MAKKQNVPNPVETMNSLMLKEISNGSFLPYPPRSWRRDLSDQSANIPAAPDLREFTETDLRAVPIDELLDLLGRIPVSLPQDGLPLASEPLPPEIKINKAFVHKQASNNILLSVPYFDGRFAYYYAGLQADEFKFDHSSIHVQGILCLEAIRQAGIATVHLSGAPLAAVIVITGLDLRYDGFLYSDQPVVMRGFLTNSRTLFSDSSEEGRIIVEVFQNNERRVTGTLKGRVLKNKALLDLIESRSDRSAVVSTRAATEARTVVGEQAPLEAPPPAASAARVTIGEVQALFAAATGYDLAELDPNYHLEADLGIDTVKQAEIFSTLRSRYGLPKDEAFQLANVQTLSEIVVYVNSQAASVKLAGARTDAPAAGVESGAGDRDRHDDSLRAELQNLFAEATGYDVTELDPMYHLEADLGIDTVKQAEILSTVRARHRLPLDESFKLEDLQTIAAIEAYVRRLRPLPPSGGAGPRPKSP